MISSNAKMKRRKQGSYWFFFVIAAPRRQSRPHLVSDSTNSKSNYVQMTASGAMQSIESNQTAKILTREISLKRFHSIECRKKDSYLPKSP